MLRHIVSCLNILCGTNSSNDFGGVKRSGKLAAKKCCKTCKNNTPQKVFPGVAEDHPLWTRVFSTFWFSFAPSNKSCAKHEGMSSIGPVRVSWFDGKVCFQNWMRCKMCTSVATGLVMLLMKLRLEVTVHTKTSANCCHKLLGAQGTFRK